MGKLVFLASAVWILGVAACGKGSEETKAPAIEVSSAKVDQAVRFSIVVTPNGKMDSVKSGLVYVTTDGAEPSEESVQLPVDLDSQVIVESHYEFDVTDSLDVSAIENPIVLKFQAMFILNHQDIKKNSTGQEETKQIDWRVASVVTTETYDEDSDSGTDISTDTAGNTDTVTDGTSNTITPTPQFHSGQAASIVIGQATFTSNAMGYDAAGLKWPEGVHLSSSGILYVADSANNRIEGFNSVPSANGASANFTVGQSSLGSNGSASAAADRFDEPRGMASTSSKLFVADTYNARVQIFTTPPSTGMSAGLAIGQSSPANGTAPSSASATVMSGPRAVSVSGSKVAIVNSSYSGVLLYNSIPTANSAAANVVLGQPNKTTSTGGSGAKMNMPSGVWTNGTKVIASDNYNHRVLIWNTWPTADGQTPDIILGQATINDNASSFQVPTASTFQQPAGVTSDGTRIVVADAGNNRLLIWNSWPTANKQAADIVLGQANFTSYGTGVTAATLDGPTAIDMDATRIFVADTYNNRVLIFEMQ